MLILLDDKLPDDSNSIPSYLNDSSDSEEEPDKFTYKWISPQSTNDRTISTCEMLKQKWFDSLLIKASLNETAPYIYSDQMINSDEHLFHCKSYLETLKRLNKTYPAQKLVWPYISIRRSGILIGNTDYYPHLLYMPAICNMIEVTY